MHKNEPTLNELYYILSHLLQDQVIGKNVTKQIEAIKIQIERAEKENIKKTSYKYI